MSLGRHASRPPHARARRRASVSRDEAAVLERIARARAARALRRSRTTGTPRAAPPGGPAPGRAARRAGGACRHRARRAAPPRPAPAAAVIGRGAADMKGGLAVMLDAGRRPRVGACDPSTSGCCSSAGRSSRSRERAPAAVRARPGGPEAAPRDRDGADGERDRGRLHGEPERTCARPDGPRRTPRARGWATTRSTRRSRCSRRSSTRPTATSRSTGWCSARSCASPRSRRGGARNVVPDRVDAHVNFRYAPDRIARGGRGAPARAARRDEPVDVEVARERAAGSRSPVAPARRTAPRGRGPGGRTQAGVDAGRRVRDGGHRRGELRAGRPAVRSSRTTSGSTSPRSSASTEILTAFLAEPGPGRT